MKRLRAAAPVLLSCCLMSLACGVSRCVSQVGQFDVVVINRGEREGVAVGNVLAIYKKGAMARDRVANETIRLPSERAGLMMVFRTFEKLSYGLVMVTGRPLAIASSTTLSTLPVRLALTTTDARRK